ncbi:MAG: cellulase-like family protein [Nakamurella sp.]
MNHHHPKLTISLWDFSWYTQSMPGEPFHDLATVFAQAIDRGYNTIRICAAPMLLFGEHELDTTKLRFAQVGEGVGQGTRWYDVAGGAVIDLRQRLVSLFEHAASAGVEVIISSWEYQQSSAFLDNPSWHDMLTAVPAQERHLALARALGRMVDFLTEHGYHEQIAYVEIHNEVDLSRLAEVAPAGVNTFWAQKPYLEAALEQLQSTHPEVLSTVCYGIPPYLDMAAVPNNAQVAHAHFYIYGVLAELEEWAQVRAAPPVFPTPELKSLLRPEAPVFEEWRATVEPWRLEATGISLSMFYAYDWVDPIAWDQWLYRHYSAHEAAMKTGLDDRLSAVAGWAQLHSVPAVIGEGWIGYTPLYADFEDGPIGQDVAAFAVARCAQLGYWGTLMGSNSAPHHPAWSNIDLQRKLNNVFLCSEVAVP